MPQTAPNLHVSQHPAVLHKLAILREEKTEPKKEAARPLPPAAPTAAPAEGVKK